MLSGFANKCFEETRHVTTVIRVEAAVGILDQLTETCSLSFFGGFWARYQMRQVRGKPGRFDSPLESDNATPRVTLLY